MFKLTSCAVFGVAFLRKIIFFECFDCLCILAKFLRTESEKKKNKKNKLTC